MKKLLFSLFLLAIPAVAAPQTDKVGPIRLTALFHASTQLEHAGKVVMVDPVSAASLTKKADLILITHTHGDHLDKAAIAKLVKPGTVIVAPPSAVETIESIEGAVVTQLKLDNAMVLNWKFAPLWVRPVRAYNIERGPGPGKKYHPFGQFYGYVINWAGERLYFAGDTEFIPEMKNLGQIDAAFLPMNLPYTMTPEEAAKAAKAIRPTTVYPYHFRSPRNKPSDAPQQFAAMLKNTKIKVKILDWYPEAAVQKAMANQ